MNLPSIVLYGYSLYSLFQKNNDTTDYSKKTEEIQINSSYFENTIAAVKARLEGEKTLHNLEYSNSIEAEFVTSVTSITNKYWDSKYHIIMKNVSETDISLFGILVKWKIADAESCFYPCTLNQIILKPDTTLDLRLAGTNNRVLFATKAQRNTARGKLKAVGKHNKLRETCSIYFIIDLQNGQYAIRELKKADNTISWDGNTSYKDCGSNQATRAKMLLNLIEEGKSGVPFTPKDNRNPNGTQQANDEEW